MDIAINLGVTGYHNYDNPSYKFDMKLFRVIKDWQAMESDPTADKLIAACDRAGVGGLAKNALIRAKKR